MTNLRRRYDPKFSAPQEDFEGSGGPNRSWKLLLHNSRPHDAAFSGIPMDAAKGLVAAKRSSHLRGGLDKPLPPLPKDRPSGGRPPNPRAESYRSVETGTSLTSLLPNAKRMSILNIGPLLRKKKEKPKPARIEMVGRGVQTSPSLLPVREPLPSPVTRPRNLGVHSFLSNSRHSFTSRSSISAKQTRKIDMNTLEELPLSSTTSESLALPPALGSHEPSHSHDYFAIPRTIKDPDAGLHGTPSSGPQSQSSLRQGLRRLFTKELSFDTLGTYESRYTAYPKPQPDDKPRPPLPRLTLSDTSAVAQLEAARPAPKRQSSVPFPSAHPGKAVLLPDRVQAMKSESDSSDTSVCRNLGAARDRNLHRLWSGHRGNSSGRTSPLSRNTQASMTQSSENEPEAIALDRKPTTSMHRVPWIYGSDNSIPESDSDEHVDVRIPEHFPQSPLCPLHPKYSGPALGSCPMHGKRRQLDDAYLATGQVPIHVPQIKNWHPVNSRPKVRPPGLGDATVSQEAGDLPKVNRKSQPRCECHARQDMLLQLDRDFSLPPTKMMNSRRRHRHRS